MHVVGFPLPFKQIENLKLLKHEIYKGFPCLWQTGYVSDFRLENFMDKGCDCDWRAARSKGHNIENTRVRN